MNVLNIIYCWFAELEPAIWVALFALALSIVVTFQNWKHNRLSVLPNIDLYHSTIGKPNEIMIISSGIGPAIIVEIKIIVEDKHYSMNALSSREEFIEEFPYISEYLFVQKGSFIFPGDSELILRFKSRDDDPEIQNFISKLELNVKWKSIYGQKFEKLLKII